jgi:hypothetical protein
MQSSNFTERLEKGKNLDIKNRGTYPTEIHIRIEYKTGEFVNPVWNVHEQVAKKS